MINGAHVVVYRQNAEADRVSFGMFRGFNRSTPVTVG